MRPKGKLFDLKRLREEYRLTQKEIAEAVNRPQSFLSAIEHGKRSAPPKFIEDLSRIYKVDNITRYSSNRDMPTNKAENNVREAIINAPGGLILLSEFTGKLTLDEMFRIVTIEEEGRQSKRVHQTLTPNSNDSSTVAELVRLLSDAQSRCNLAEARVKELEAQVLDLQSRLPKKKRRTQ